MSAPTSLVRVSRLRWVLLSAQVAGPAGQELLGLLDERPPHRGHHDLFGHRAQLGQRLRQRRELPIGASGFAAAAAPGNAGATRPPRASFLGPSSADRSR